jgi:hypothetical protein
VKAARRVSRQGSADSNGFLPARPLVVACLSAAPSAHGSCRHWRRRRESNLRLSAVMPERVCTCSCPEQDRLAPWRTLARVARKSAPARQGQVPPLLGWVLLNGKQVAQGRILLLEAHEPEPRKPQMLSGLAVSYLGTLEYDLGSTERQRLAPSLSRRCFRRGVRSRPWFSRSLMK